MKLIAIGNRLMGDDGAAIEAAAALYEELTQAGVQVIIGETDAEYCMGFINEGDCVFILDAAVSDGTWGSVWQLPLNSAINNYASKQTQHDMDLLCILKNRGLQLTGLLICIAAADMSLRWGLSEAIHSQLPIICQEVKKIILGFRGDLTYA